ncbi:MAG: hypothetical protein ACFFAU_11475 [Candidatus Hodarchaeota archaeon]
MISKEIDKDNPCPHCGNTESLTERKEVDFKPVIPEDLQYDFKKGEEDLNNKFIPRTPKELYGTINYSPFVLPKPAPKRVSQDIPLDSIIPTIDNVSLDPASQKVYFQLSIEYQIILDKAPNYQEGVYRWKLLLPDRLQSYGLTEDVWKRISAIGDLDDKIQEHLNYLLKKIFG